MEFRNLIELLQYRAAHQPDKQAYIFLDDSLKQTSSVTYHELEQKVLAIASVLQREELYGERALLLYNPGMEYIAAFFGCLYAGVIPVPAYPPESRNLTRLQSIMTNAEPAICLSSTSIIRSMIHFQDQPDDTLFFTCHSQTDNNLAAGLYNLRWMATDLADLSVASQWSEPDVKSGSLAFLQYTSGSTSDPKGVMVTHGNLLHNSKLIKNSFGIDADSQLVSWLPPYHDMGLIGGILQPLFAGATVTLMSPFSFLKRPVNWLKTITDCSGKGYVVSAAPDFGYNLCVSKVREDQLDGLDLRNWRVASSGAEPVRPETLERFKRKFSVCGFGDHVFFPVYGLAEATLLASAGKVASAPVIRNFNETLIKQNKVSELQADFIFNSTQLVGCGSNMPGQELLIVNPDTCMPSDPSNIGEIWLRGPSVAKGYWNNAEATHNSFQSFVSLPNDTKKGPYFRTGDLGFIVKGDLFITGRLKDLIIIRGQNHYPQDIELSVMESDEALRPDCGAAFTVDRNGEEQLVIVQEVKREFLRKIDSDETFSAIIRAVSGNHKIQVSSIVLIEPSTIPKTTSGKLQRNSCKMHYLNGNLKKIDEFNIIKMPELLHKHHVNYHV